MTIMWISSALVAVAAAFGWGRFWHDVPGTPRGAEAFVISMLVGLGVGGMFWFDLALAYA